MVCVDANLVTLTLGPHRSPQLLEQWAEWSASGTSLVAPQLIRYEVTNALYQMVRHRQISNELAEEALNTSLNLPIQLHAESALHLSALAFATRFSISATYDAHYLALAEHLGCDLWTADKRLYNSVRHQLSWVQLLELDPS